MISWLRYSVAIYVGLLLAGSLTMPEPQMSNAEHVSAPPIADQATSPGVFNYQPAPLPTWENGCWESAAESADVEDQPFDR